MSLMTTISIGTTALITFGSAIFYFCGFGVSSHGRSSTENYITWRERSTLWDMKGTRILERFMCGITACHCGTLPWSFIGLTFRVWTQPLKLCPLCCSVSSLPSVLSLVLSRWRRIGRRKRKCYSTGCATRFQERLRQRLTIVGFLLFHLVAVSAFSLVGFCLERAGKAGCLELELMAVLQRHGWVVRVRVYFSCTMKTATLAVGVLLLDRSGIKQDGNDRKIKSTGKERFRIGTS